MELRSGSPVGVPGPAVASWRVAPGLVVVKVSGTAVLALVVLITILAGGDRIQALVAGAGAVVLGAFALRDLIVPVRVAANGAGLTLVTGFVRRSRLSWPQIEAVRVDARSRYGLATEYLEIDTGDAIHLYSRYDLSAPPRDVAAALTAIQPPADTDP